MRQPKDLPVALAIAGSDSGGGAGLQADLKTFAALGVHGATVVTCVTAQSPRRVRAIQACDLKIVRHQLDAVLEELSPAAVKTGMLFSRGIVRVVANSFQHSRHPPLIVDPIMAATSGRRLLASGALKAIQVELLPLATLVTPNLDEAAVLAGRKIRSIEEMRSAAREIKARYGCAALVKGGHLREGREAADVFYDGTTELLLVAPFVRGVATHGTGCVYSAAIAGWLALGFDLPRAVERAKQYVTRAIVGTVQASGHAILDHFHRGSAECRVSTRLRSVRR